jgi:hypothetical protein
MRVVGMKINIKLIPAKGANIGMNRIISIVKG